jgi:hypothetical protein
MGTEARNEVMNFYQIGMVGHWLNLVDYELYFGEIAGVVHDRTNGFYRILVTLKTESGFVSIQVY